MLKYKKKGRFFKNIVSKELFSITYFEGLVLLPQGTMKKGDLLFNSKYLGSNLRES